MSVVLVNHTATISGAEVSLLDLIAGLGVEHRVTVAVPRGPLADAARERYQKIHARFAQEPGAIDLAGAHVLRQQGRELEILVNGNSRDVMDRLKARSPQTLTSEALSLEEIFVATLSPREVVA